jgi:hypothetical protein
LCSGWDRCDGGRDNDTDTDADSLASSVLTLACPDDVRRVCADTTAAGSDGKAEAEAGPMAEGEDENEDG